MLHPDPHKAIEAALATVSDDGDDPQEHYDLRFTAWVLQGRRRDSALPYTGFDLAKAKILTEEAADVLHAYAKSLERDITWWRRCDQPPPYFAPEVAGLRIAAAFPERQRIMVFCQSMTGTRPIDWQDIEDNGSVMRAREADLIVEMKPAGFVYVLKDRFGLRHTLRSIWRLP
jgi:hypothetical protein